MPEYSLGFSKKLIEAACIISQEYIDDVDAVRTILYLSSLSSEISLKALLEQAGVPVSDIKNLRHSLGELLTHVGKCQIQEEVTSGTRAWVPATRIRSIVVDHRYGDATVGKILTGEECGASNYPNELRYGDRLRDYSVELKLGAAKAVVEWATEHWNEIRLSGRQPRA